MSSPRLNSSLSQAQRRFLVTYGTGVLCALVLFIALSQWLDIRSKHRQQALFNDQQARQVMLARQAIQEHLDTALAATEIVADHALAEFVRGQRNEESMINLYRTAESRIPALLALAFLETPVYFATHASDYVHKGYPAQVQGIQWGGEYWDQLRPRREGVFVPPFAVSDDLRAMGVLLPVRLEGRFAGLFVVVVDMQPVIDRYVALLRSGREGRGLLLDGRGNVLFDTRSALVGTNIVDRAREQGAAGPTLDRRMLLEPSGTGSFAQPAPRGERPRFRLTAWDSLAIGGERLIVALSAPDTEVDATLESLRLERGLLAVVLLAALLGAGAYSWRRTTRHEIATAQKQVLDIIEFLPDPTFAVDREGRIIAWNRAIAAMTGAPRERMLGKGDMEYSLPFYGERRRGLIDLLDEAPDSVDTRYRNVESDGRTLNAETFVPMVYGGRGAHVWARASRLLDEAGNSVGAIESIRDISERMEAERALRQSEERYALALTGANDGIWDWDLVSGAMYFSPRWKEIIGYRDDEIEAEIEAWRSRIHPDDWELIMDANTRVAEGRAPNFQVEYRLRHKDGSYRWILGRGAGLRGPDGRVVRMSGAHTDITERKQAEAAMRIMLDISSAVSTTHDLPDLYAAVHDILQRHIGAENFLIALVDEQHDQIDFAYARDPHHGLPWEPVAISSLEGAGLCLAVYSSGEPMLLSRQQQIAMRVIGEPAEVWCGVPLRVRDKVIGVMAVQDYFDPRGYTEKDLALLTSVSEQVALAIERRHYEEQIRHQALHDSLTGLPNRVLFMDRLERAMRRAVRREGYRYAVLMLDLDRFKMVNDSHGHMVGDLLLMEAARRIQPVLRQVDTLSRLGGDEFAILLEEFDKPQQVIHIVHRIQEALTRPMRLDGHEIHSGASVGVVLRTGGYGSPEEILRDSDIAMYQAKRQGKGLFRVFNSSMHDQAVRAMTLENDMAQALATGSFHLHFQPVFDARDLRLSGFEALLRWDHPEHGAIPPAQFIPVAEETGIIVPLGEWVLHQACRTMAAWREAIPACRDLVLAVNLSARQASQVSVVRSVRQALDSTGLPPQALRLELTETAVMEDPLASLERLWRLKRLGVGLAIDDFGTGHSSLAYLSRFPVDTLKVDHSFVLGLDGQPENLEIIRSIVALAQTLGLSVVAEGVENAAQLDAVRDIGCTCVQGYHLGRPLPPDQAKALIASC